MDRGGEPTSFGFLFLFSRDEATLRVRGSVGRSVKAFRPTRSNLCRVWLYPVYGLVSLPLPSLVVSYLYYLACSAFPSSFPAANDNLATNSNPGYFTDFLLLTRSFFPSTNIYPFDYILAVNEMTFK